MGARVCRLVRRLAPTVLLIGANRSGRGHPELPIRKVEVGDQRALAELLATADLVINAVGPYLYDPAPVVHAAISARCHYADLAERREFIARVAEVAGRRQAAKSAVVLVPGCSTMPGLVSVLAQRWKRETAVARLRVHLSMGSRNPVTAGLLAGLLEPLGRRHAEGRWFDRLERHRTLDDRSLLFGSYPSALPDTGLALGARVVPVHFRVGFDRAWMNRLLRVAAPGLGRLPRGAVRRLATGLRPLISLARRLGTEAGVLSLVAEDAAGSELGRLEVHAETQGLDIPALPAAWLVRALVAEGWLAAPGVRGLERVLGAEAAVAALREAGYSVRVR